MPSRLESSHALLDVTCGAAVPPLGPQRAATTVLVRGALESAFLGSPHPRTRATLSTVVVSDNGCALASSVTAACAACCVAGLPLSHTIGASRLQSCTCTPTLTDARAAAVAVAQTPAGELRLHPSRAEEEEARCTLTFAFSAPGAAAGDAREEAAVVMSSMRGRCTVEAFVASLECARAEAREVERRVRETVVS